MNLKEKEKEKTQKSKVFSCLWASLVTKKNTKKSKVVFKLELGLKNLRPKIKSGVFKF